MAFPQVTSIPMDNELFEAFSRALIASQMLRMLDDNRSQGKYFKNISYEKRNILERYLLTLRQKDGKKIANKNFVSELVNKKIMNAEDAKKMLARFSEIKVLLEKENSSLDFTISDDFITIVCSRHKIIEKSTPKLVERLNFLAASPKDTAILMLNYYSILSASQHWGLTSSHWAKLVTFGVRNEAFASPINSRIIISGGNYFSIFPHDTVFGSRGNFFDCDMDDYPGDWCINPPFTEDLMEKTVDKVLKFLEYDNLIGSPVNIFLLMPSWDDAKAVNKLRASEYKIFEKKLVKGSYNFEDKNGVEFVSCVDSLYFVLSKDSSPEKIKILESII
jgi:hypothetical protein